MTLHKVKALVIEWKLDLFRFHEKLDIYMFNKEVMQIRIQKYR